MPPKVKITKEDIVKAAVSIVRERGEAALNARDIAKVLNCSTQPVFSNFSTMEELRSAVVCAADALFQDYMKRETESGKFVPYKASGVAYIRFAKDEKELFKLLYMRDRTAENGEEVNDVGEQMTTMVQGNTGLSKNDADLFHLEMWAYVHGIATMFATNYLELDWDVISIMLTDAYEGLKKRYRDKEERS